MYVDWTRHLQDPQQKADFVKQVLHSKEVLDRLTVLCKEKEETIDRSELDIKNFDQPNWEHRQAFKNGMRSVLHYFKTLINLDQQEPK